MHGKKKKICNHEAPTALDMGVGSRGYSAGILGRGGDGWAIKKTSPGTARFIY